MPQPTKKYVFTEIVSDVNNYQQLLAYAIYKADKHLVATSLVDDFVSPAKGFNNFMMPSPILPVFRQGFSFVLNKYAHS